jgi:hypothetical protein
MDLVTFITGKHLLILGDEIQVSTWQSVGYVALISSLEEELDLLKYSLFFHRACCYHILLKTQLMHCI